MRSASALYRLLGDDARLRILRLLAAERLNVTELTSILGIAQSGVSRHLGLLKESGLVAEQREGGFTYYRAATQDPDGVRPVWDLLERQFAEAAEDPLVRADEARLTEVRRLRKESFVTHGSTGRQLVPGRSWAAWARALGLLLPPLTVADLGCGDGYLTLEAARWARQVVAVDRSREVLATARALAARRKVRNITWKQGELESLPLPDGAVDVVLLSQALHHAADPAVALREARRALVPGGRLLLLDLRRHAEAWVRDRLGDLWLGFEPEELKILIGEAGFADVRVRVGARLTGDPFTVLIACGTTHREARPRERGGARTAAGGGAGRAGRPNAGRAADASPLPTPAQSLR